MTSTRGSIVVTGSNGGLGSAILGQILNNPDIAQNYHGIYTVRKVESATTASKVLEKANKSNHSHELISLDLSSLTSTRKAAEDINRRVASGALPPIRALILNAAYQEHDSQSFTNDGFDMTFQSNHLSHFLLTLLLLESMDKEHGRIVVLGSWTHDTTDPRNKIGPIGSMYAPEKYQHIFNQPIDTEALAKGRWSSEKEHPGDSNAGMRRYGASKLCQVMIFRELSTRLARDANLSKISVLAVDPAAMPSSLTRRGNWLLSSVIIPIMILVTPLVSYFNPNGDLRTPRKSAADVVRAAFDTEDLGKHPNGIYLNGSVVADVGPEAKDAEKVERLWRDGIEYAEVKEGDTVLQNWR